MGDELSISIGALGALIVFATPLVIWILKLKNQLILLKERVTVQAEEDKKIHERITKTQLDVKENKAASDSGFRKMTEKLSTVERNIIDRINIIDKG